MIEALKSMKEGRFFDLEKAVEIYAEWEVNEEFAEDAQYGIEMSSEYWNDRREEICRAFAEYSAKEQFTAIMESQERKVGRLMMSR